MFGQTLCILSQSGVLALLMSTTVSEQMRHTGSVLPVGRMNMNESVHSGLKATFLFLESAMCNYLSLPVCC